MTLGSSKVCTETFNSEPGGTVCKSRQFVPMGFRCKTNSEKLQACSPAFPFGTESHFQFSFAFSKKPNQNKTKNQLISGDWKHNEWVKQNAHQPQRVLLLKISAI